MVSTRALATIRKAMAKAAQCNWTLNVSPQLSSSFLTLVLVAPICRPGQTKIYNVARDETARIVCDLEANPTDVNFTWVFNNSVDTVDIPQNRISSDKARSILTYTPVNELDYGTVLCSGRNEIGAQKQPCVYHLNPAGKFDGPLAALAFNRSSR